jgi:hypothetical protein
MMSNISWLYATVAVLGLSALAILLPFLMHSLGM